MTQKQDYTSDEWQLLLEVPPLVGASVMMAGKSGLGTMKEAMALAKSVLDARHGYEDNELIQALMTARLEDKERSEIEKLGGGSHYKSSPNELLETAAEKCRSAIALLEAHDPSEAAGFKEWTMHVAQSVAEAAKEGGFLGIGGERVSQEERDALDKIAAALGLD